MTKIELKAELEASLANANSDFEKNVIQAEYEHKIKLLGLQEEIAQNNLKNNDSDFQCIGCSG